MQYCRLWYQLEQGCDSLAVGFYMRFILNLLCEVMSGLLLWQAVQALQRRMAVLKAPPLSEELGRLISHSLRVCSRACAGNQTGTGEGIHPKITSKGWACQGPAEIGNLHLGSDPSVKETHFQVWDSEESEQTARGFTVIIPGLLPDDRKVVLVVIWRIRI